MTSRRNRVLHAAIVFALSQAALAESPQSPAETADTSALQAAGTATRIAQAAPDKPAAGKEAPKGAAAKDVVTKGEQVVVTARRREELIQDVPGRSERVFRRGRSNRRASRTSPASRTSRRTRRSRPRGPPTRRSPPSSAAIGQQDPVAGYEQGVGIYLDDIYLARPQGALMDIYDLARIEILRGPQGTLYGRNTIGGAVKYVTRGYRPTRSSTSRRRSGNYGEKDLVVRGSLPDQRQRSPGRHGRHVQPRRIRQERRERHGQLQQGRRWPGASAPSSRRPASLFIRVAADRTTDDSLPKQGYRLTVGPPPATSPCSPASSTRARTSTRCSGRQQEVVTCGDSLLVEWTINPDLPFKSITALAQGRVRSRRSTSTRSTTPLFEAPALYRDEQTSQEFQLTYTGAKLAGRGRRVLHEGERVQRVRRAVQRLGRAVALHAGRHRHEDLGGVRRRELQRHAHVRRDPRRALHQRPAPGAHLQEDLPGPQRIADARQPERRRTAAQHRPEQERPRPHRHQVHAQGRARLEVRAGTEPVPHVRGRLQGRLLRSAHGPGRQPQQPHVAREAQGREARGGRDLRAGPEVRVRRRPHPDQRRRVLHATTRTSRSRARSPPTTPPETSPASPAT